MNRWNGKVAVITGASAGIGLEIAKALVCEGMIVVGLARRKNKMLHEMSKVKGSGKFIGKECDISKQKDVTAVFQDIKNTFQTVHILINNAGILKQKSIEEADMGELQQVVDVNFMGVLRCSKEAIKLMKANNHEAHIINISSIAGHQVPNIKLDDGSTFNINIYSATKFALKALSKILIRELNSSKIRITNLSPGFVKTEILNECQGQNLMKIPFLQGEDVANAVVYVIGVPANVQITELTIQPLGEHY